jgi:predicted MPP superfamily phosphohydrolase
LRFVKAERASAVRTGGGRRLSRRKPKRRSWPIFLAIIFAGAAALLAYGYNQALRDPIVRSIHLEEPSWPRGVRPIRLVLMSDLHVQGPDMPPERLARIVAMVNKLHPDIVVLAGDYTSSAYFATRTYSLPEAVAPLRLLNARLGKIAVLGNHDRDNVADSRAALEEVGLTVLENEAIEIGPLAIGAVHWGLKKALRRLRERNGIKILVAHGPDPFPRLPDDVSLMLAGHTHCGQIVLPLIGALTTGSKYGRRYMCGVVHGQNNMLIVTAGLGTSRVPLRLNAPPDIWLISLEPAQAAIGQAH